MNKADIEKYYCVKYECRSCWGHIIKDELDEHQKQCEEYKQHKRGMMKKFRLGLITGGLMEDPNFHVDVDTIRTVHAKNLREAKAKWAKETKHDDPEYWDKEQQTYWHWQVKEV